MLLKPSPVQITALATTVVEMATFDVHTCARKGDGTLWCWGDNSYGQVGDGTTFLKPAPVQVASLGTGVVGVAAGYRHTCARKADGTLWCWGDDSYGQLGNGTTQGTSCGASKVCQLSPAQSALCP